MQISLDSNLGLYVIRAYENGRIQINTNWYERSVIVTPNQLIETWQPQSLDELNENHLQLILDLNPEVVLLGSGERMQFPATHFLNKFYRHQIGVEVMPTSAACRTFNALAAENRQVVAALLLH